MNCRDRRRATSELRQETFRERRRHGLRIAQVAVNARTVSLLVALHYLDDDDATDLAKIALAIFHFLNSTAEQYERTAAEIELSQENLKGQQPFKKPRPYRRQ